MTTGPVDFEWVWSGGSLPAPLGFEVSVWQEGEPQAGVHDAVQDALEGNIEQTGSDHYRLPVTDIRHAAGVRGRSGTYLWTAAIVRVSPGYLPTGVQASPSSFQYEAG